MKVELATVFLFTLLVLHPSTMKYVAAAGEDFQNETAVDTKKPSEGEEVKVDEKPSLVSPQESEKGDKENVNSDEGKTGGVKEKKQTSSDSKRATNVGKSSSKFDDSNTSEEERNMSEEEGGQTRKTNVVSRSSNSRRTTKQKGSKKTDDSADEEEVEPLSDDEIQQLRAGLMFRGADEDKAKADPDAAAAAAGKDKIAAVVTTSAPTAAKAGGNTIKTSTLFTSSLGALSLLVIAFRHGFPGSM